ncbi:MAG: hypothetical protein ABW125_09700, partial [Candidatus Thiodiazotropha lotti]
CRVGPCPTKYADGQVSNQVKHHHDHRINTDALIFPDSNTLMGEGAPEAFHLAKTWFRVITPLTKPVKDLLNRLD